MRALERAITKFSFTFGPKVAKNMGVIIGGPVFTMKTDLNSNDCQWKHMGKSITDYIKAQGEGLPKQLSELHFDEIQEFAVYDCTSRQNRREILGKRVRKVFVDEPICLKLVFKNDLGLRMHL